MVNWLVTYIFRFRTRKVVLELATITKKSVVLAQLDVQAVGQVHLAAGLSDKVCRIHYCPAFDL
jgi:hypothetical protein